MSSPTSPRSTSPGASIPSVSGNPSPQPSQPLSSTTPPSSNPRSSTAAIDLTISGSSVVMPPPPPTLPSSSVATSSATTVQPANGPKPIERTIWNTLLRPVGLFSRAIHLILYAGYWVGNKGLDLAAYCFKNMKDEYNKGEESNPLIAGLWGLASGGVYLISGAATVAFGLVKAPYYWWNLGIEALDKLMDKKINEAVVPDKFWWKVLFKGIIKPLLFVADFLFVATLIALTPIAAVAQVGATAVGGLLGLFGISGSAVISGLVAAAKGIANLITAIFTIPAVEAPVLVVAAAATVAAKPVSDRAQEQGEKIEKAIDNATGLQHKEESKPIVTGTDPSLTTPLNPQAVTRAALNNATATMNTTPSPNAATTPANVNAGSGPSSTTSTNTSPNAQVLTSAEQAELSNRTFLNA